MLGAKIARRTQLILLMASFGLFNGLSALAPTYGWMLVLRFLSGLPHGANFGSLRSSPRLSSPTTSAHRPWAA